MDNVLSVCFFLHFSPCGYMR